MTFVVLYHHLALLECRESRNAYGRLEGCLLTVETQLTSRLWLQFHACEMPFILVGLWTFFTWYPGSRHHGISKSVKNLRWAVHVGDCSCHSSGGTKSYTWLGPKWKDHKIGSTLTKWLAYGENPPRHRDSPWKPITVGLCSSRKMGWSWNGLGGRWGWTCWSAPMDL